MQSLYRRGLPWILASLVVVCAGCHSDRGLPSKSSEAYAALVSDFYVGLAALQVGDDVRADSMLSKTTQLAPGEPATWANWGILALRQRNFDAASQRLHRAQTLLPKDGRIYYLLGLLESDRGNSAEAIADLRRAIDLDPKDLRAMYRLGLEVERQGGQNSEVEFQQLIQQILQEQPDNLAALLELNRMAAKRGDTATLHSAVARLSALSADWPPEARQQLASLKAAADGPAPRSAAIQSMFLRNVLMPLPEFRQNLQQIKPPTGEEAVPFTHFLRMETPSFRPAPADTAMSFEPESAATSLSGRWNWIGAICSLPFFSM